MSNYKKMMGYGKKNKKQSKSKITVVDKIKKELNEWNNTEFKNMPKRWSGASMTGLTEYEKLKEGPSYEYAGYMKKIEKAENLQAKEVNKLVKLLDKKGLKREARDLASFYMKGTRDFDNFMKKLYRKLA